MKLQKLLVATVVLGVVWNVLDFVVHGMILSGSYYSQLTALFRQDVPIAWFVIGDFIAAFVFVWIFDRLSGGFGGGPKGGATYGLYAGILVNFPTWIFAHLLYVGFPYGLAWIWTIYGIIAFVIAGAVTGTMYKKSTSASTT